MEDYLHWKTTFNERKSWMEDDLQWKMTNKGRMIMGEVSLQKSFSYWKAHGAGHIPLCGIAKLSSSWEWTLLQLICIQLMKNILLQLVVASG